MPSQVLHICYAGDGAREVVLSLPTVRPLGGCPDQQHLALARGDHSHTAMFLYARTRMQ